MNWLKHLLLTAIIAFVSLLNLVAQSGKLEMAKGPFEATNVSLENYQYPEWFRDAKFGIWSHWGPQSVPEKGGWYASDMYLAREKDRKIGPHVNGPDEPNPNYTSHLEMYGHPSKFGYKDIIPLWKAERFDPEKLMKLYKQVGAKYFVSMGSHHDNFALYNSKISRWNSVNMGPKRDIVAEWQKAAKKNGLPFGISEHLAASYTFFQPAHWSDPDGKMKGVPYDGNDPQYADLYHKKLKPEDNGWLTTDLECQEEWYTKVKEIIDLYHPDLLYSDSKLPFNNIGRTMLAHYYNQDFARNGKTSVVYNCKEQSKGRFVRDMERGINDGISEYPWQTDTSIGDWFYAENDTYKTSTEVIQMLVDIVSKNGNLLLNIVQTPEGDLEEKVLAIVNEIGLWFKDNGTAIYGTRPWKVYGEGPSMNNLQEKGDHEGLKEVRKYEGNDIRFTTKDGVLYAFTLDHPKSEIIIKYIGATDRVSSVKRLGSREKIQFSQDGNGVLVIQKPVKMPDYKVLAFEIKFLQK